VPDVIHLRHGDCRATVSLAGAAILSAEVGGSKLLEPAASPGLATRLHGMEACFPLVPFCGRVEDNHLEFRGKRHRLVPNTSDPLALHGDGWLEEWSVAEASPRHLSLTLDHRADARGPYRYSARQTVELLPNGMRLELSVCNTGEDVLPFGLGFHPYLPLADGCRLEFAAGARWTERDDHLPGERVGLEGIFDFSLPRSVPDDWMNTCYEAWSGRATVRYPNGDAITLTADPALSWLMLYKPAGAASFLCLEPMSHKPGAVVEGGAGGWMPLAPGASFSGSMTLERSRAIR